MYPPSQSFSHPQGRRLSGSADSRSLAADIEQMYRRGPWASAFDKFQPTKISNRNSGKFSSAGMSVADRYVRRTKGRLPVSSPLLIAGTFRGSEITKLGSGARRRWQLAGGRCSHTCRVKLGPEEDTDGGPEREIDFGEENGLLAKKLGQGACWLATFVYVGWLFLLPYAPGDPVWTITPSTIQMLIDLSLNFFFVLPLASIVASAAGVHGLSAPLQHPTSEALFNFMIGWTLLFAPLLFTDRKRDRLGGSLELLWIIQMFLTNTVLAPYMAIRQNRVPADDSVSAPNRFETSVPSAVSNLGWLSRGLTAGATKVAVTGAVVGVVSMFWFAMGRPEGGFGGISARWEYFVHYVASERLAYAFIWDVVLYAIFQPWLIGDNLINVKLQNRNAVRILRFVPYVGLVAYLLGLREGVTSEDERQ